MFEENEMFEQFSSKFAAYFSLYVTGNEKTTKKGERMNEVKRQKCSKYLGDQDEVASLWKSRIEREGSFFYFLIQYDVIKIRSKGINITSKWIFN